MLGWALAFALTGAMVWAMNRAMAAGPGPYVVTDPVAVGVTQCGVYLDAMPKVVIPVTSLASSNICQYDLSTATIAIGAHSIMMTAMFSDPGSLESPQSIPLAFAWPIRIPARPGGLRLQP